MKASFSPAVIGELRRRVIDHNEALPDDSRETGLVKLGFLKRLYKQFYGGPDPHTHALAKIDERLGQIRGDDLGKAKGFDAGEHPRNRRGQFQPGGGGGEPPPPSTPVASGPSDDGDGLKTQIIPETRYSVFGPAIAGAAGIGYGAISGAAASYGGGPVDRLQHKVAGFVGNRLGGLTAGSLAQVPIDGARLVSRSAIGAVNWVAGTTLPRPGPNAGKGIIEGAARLGAKGGEKTARGLSQAMSFAYNGPAAAIRNATTRRYGPIRGRIGGGLVGAVVPGALLYAPSLYHLQSHLGTYMDTAFPRKVRKLAPLLDSPEVLAKQAELLGDLQKANISGIVRGAARGAQRILATLHPSVASHAIGAQATGPAFTAAQQAFADGGNFAVRSLRTMVPGTAPLVAGHAAALTGIGAGAGAIAGAAGVAARDLFSSDKHPRDTHGRFTSKGRGAVAGAKIGGAVGLGVGLLAGIVAARRGHTALLRTAVQRLGGAVDGMRTAAENTARQAHATAFIADNKRNIAAFAPGTSPTHTQVKEALEAHAVSSWITGEGAAIRGGPRNWYLHQLDRSFDRRALRDLQAVAPIENGKRVPLPTRNGERATHGLINAIDEDKLDPGQRKLWDSLVSQRKATIDEIDKVYAERAVHADTIASHLTGLREEAAKIRRDVSYIPERANELDHNDEPLAAIRSFAKERLGHDLQAKTKKAGIEELRDAIHAWEVKANSRLGTIQTELDQTTPMLDAARSASAKDLADSERMAVSNPFASGTRSYFEALPDFEVRKAAVQQSASRLFTRESDEHAKGAVDHLNGMITAQQAALESRIPQVGITGRAMQRAAPILSGHLQQAMADYRVLASANRDALTGVQKQIFDYVRMNSNPKQAAVAIKGLATTTRTKATASGQFLLRHWKSVTTGLGIASALGAIDFSTPKQPFRRPKNWTTPKNIRLEIDPIDPVNKPNEALFGLSYRDRDNQQRFLHGIHIHSATGAHTIIPFGANVEAVKNQVRNRGGGGNRAQAENLPVKDPKAVRDAVDQLKAQNNIAQVGPGDARFAERQGGNVGNQEKEVADAFYTQNLKFIEHVAHSSTNKPVPYWNSLKSLFESPGMELLSRRRRVNLLIGGGDYKRGIFANPNGVFAEPGKENRGNVLSAVIKQMQLHTPAGPDAYRQMKRATWLLGEHYGFSDNEKTMLTNALEKLYTNSTGRVPPQSTPAGPGPAASMAAAGSKARSIEVQDRLIDEIPESMRPDLFRGDDDFRDTVDAVYKKHVANLRRSMAPGTSEEAIHNRAAKAVDEWIESQIEKQAPGGSLRKFLSWNAEASGAPKPPKAPKLPGTGVAMTPGTPKAPSIAGAGKTPPLAARIGVKHAANEVGSYGGGQLGYDVAAGLKNFIPGGGIAGTAARALAPSIGGVIGSQASIHGANKLGAKLGDNTTNEDPADETLARLGGGSVAQLGAAHAAHGFSQKAGQQLANRLATTGVGRATGAVAERVGQTGVGRAIAGAAARAEARGALPGIGAKIAGSAAGRAVGAAGSVFSNLGRKALGGFFRRAGGEIGSTVGGAGGAVAGTVAEPGAGTIGGRIGGKIVGGAIGTGAGWLADEGIGYLYRHLGGYGAHVPEMAAKHLGVTPQIRAKHAAMMTQKA